MKQKDKTEICKVHNSAWLLPFTISGNSAGTQDSRPDDIRRPSVEEEEVELELEPLRHLYRIVVRSNDTLNGGCDIFEENGRTPIFRLVDESQKELKSTGDGDEAGSSRRWGSVTYKLITANGGRDVARFTAHIGFFGLRSTMTVQSATSSAPIIGTIRQSPQGPSCPLRLPPLRKAQIYTADGEKALTLVENRLTSELMMPYYGVPRVVGRIENETIQRQKKRIPVERKPSIFDSADDFVQIGSLRLTPVRKSSSTTSSLPKTHPAAPSSKPNLDSIKYDPHKKKKTTPPVEVIQSDFSISFCSNLAVKHKLCVLGAHLLQYHEGIERMVLLRNYILTGFVIFIGMVVITVIILYVK